MVQRCLQQVATQRLFEAGGQDRSRTLEPEHFDLVVLGPGLEDREQGVGRQDRIDLGQQAGDVVAPVAHDFRSDDEFLEQPDFELEHVAIDRDTSQPVGQPRDLLTDRREFGERQHRRSGCQMFEIRDRVDRFDVAGQGGDRVAQAARDIDHHQQHGDRGNRNRRQPGDREALPMGRDQRADRLRHRNRPEHCAGGRVGVALQARRVGDQRHHEAYFAVVVLLHRTRTAYGLQNRRIGRGLLDLAIERGDEGRAINVDARRAAVGGMAQRGQECLELLPVPAGAHKLEHAVEADPRQQLGVGDRILPQAAFISFGKRVIAEREQTCRQQGRCDEEESADGTGHGQAAIGSDRPARGERRTQAGPVPAFGCNSRACDRGDLP